ncbi:MAG: ImmA/IrrE family metallo-endopeptidase [Psychrobacter sp.]|nr:ImmA/IrrE family metallo-endopeptidase [Psychrobacter sp.]
MSNAYAVRFARSILENYWDKTLPVNLTDIAEKLGVQVVYDSFSQGIFGSGDDISGTFKYVDGVPTCTVNINHHRNRQRFTLAHELGHFVLEHGEKSDNSQTLYRQNNHTDPVEIEANNFAAELLMPKTAISILIREESFGISELAEWFEVSEQAMYFRLKNLGWL